MCTCSKPQDKKTEPGTSPLQGTSGGQGISPLHNIIAVTNRHLCSRPLTEQVERICRLSPKAVILREKDLTEEEYALAAEEIMEICSRYSVPCILHTFAETAINLNCPAIHLPLPLLRRHQAEGTWDRIKDNFSIIGTSVHSVEEAIEVEKLGAACITAGHIYATDCKKGLPPRGPRFLQAVCESVSIPVYAIGGIHMEGKHVSKKQMEEIMACGAAGGCVMSGMMTV